MSIVGISLRANIAELRQLQEGLTTLFTPQKNAETTAAAIRKAVRPVLQRLEEITPVGPTGNLKRAAALKVVRYNRDGVAVGLVGYRRAGAAESTSAAGGSVRASKDRAFHQWFVEQGTRDRFVGKLADKPFTRKSHTRRYRNGTTVEVQQHQVKGQGAVIASSFNRLGPFKVVRAGDGESGGGRVQTDPAYPRAFFKKGRKGETAIKINASPPGGRAGVPPLKTAWDQTRPAVAEILVRELRISMEQAVAALRTFAGALGD
jgi:hypothetical protein